MPPTPRVRRPPPIALAEDHDNMPCATTAHESAVGVSFPRRHLHAPALPAPAVPPSALPPPLVVPEHDVRRDYRSPDVKRTYPFLPHQVDAEGPGRRLRHCLAHDELAYMSIRREYPNFVPPHLNALPLLATTPRPAPAPSLGATRRELFVTTVERAWTWMRGGAALLRPSSRPPSRSPRPERAR